MSSTRPDFENWTDEDFETRADEVCAYAHSVELSDADWMFGAEYRLRLIAERSEELADYAESFDPDRAQQMPIAEYRLWRVVRNRSADEGLRLDAIAAARSDGVPIDRIAEIVGVSADAARDLCGESVGPRRSRESRSGSRSLGI